MAMFRHWTLALGLPLFSLGCPAEGSEDSTTETADDEADTTGDDTTTGDGDTTTSDDTTTDADTTDAETTDAETTDAETTDDATTGDIEIVEFAAVHEILVAEGCTAGYCHGGGQGGLMMTDAVTAYMNLVNVDATMALCGLTKRVVPGDPDSSIMWMRARPIAMDMGMPCAPKMPQGSMGLPDAEAQVVFDWIANGALP